MAVRWRDTAEKIANLERVSQRAEPADPDDVEHRLEWLRAAAETIVTNTLLDCGVPIEGRTPEGVSSVVAELSVTVKDIIDAGLVALRRKRIERLRAEVANADAEVTALRAELAELEELVPPTGVTHGR